MPTARRIASNQDVLAFVADHGLPVVVKPVCGMGSINTTVVLNGTAVNNGGGKGVVGREGGGAARDED